MLNEPRSPLILLLPIGGDTVENDDNDQDSEANFKHRGCKKNAIPSLPILPEYLLEIVSSMISQAVQTYLTLKM